ncbi:MAG: adenosylcobalamin-dependent ribonucleoside-diphosphate reductase [Patescibacteria group bacterium]
MPPLEAPQYKERRGVYRDDGLRFERRFTKDGVSPYDLVTYEKRASVIREPDGTVVFEMKDIEVPNTWSQVAVDILAQKYFRKTGVPQYGADGAIMKENDGSPMLGPERSVRQIVHRLAGCWRYWGEKYGYFASEQDAQIFYDEMVYMLLTQMAAPNSPQWFNTGLHWAYGIEGPPQGHWIVDNDTGESRLALNAYEHPQPHACVVGDTMLLTNEGLLPIQYIVEKQRTDLSVFDGKGWAQIVAVKENGVRDVYRMRLSNGQYVDITSDHLVFAATTRMKEGGSYAWKPAGSVLGCKVLFTTKPSAVPLPMMMAPARARVGAALAELIGFHVGDGYAVTYGGTSLFGVATATRDEYERVSGLFKTVFGAYTVTEKPDVTAEYRIVNHNFKETIKFRELYELGLGSRHVVVPQKIFAARAGAQRAFLRGLFQADGAVRIRKENGRNSGDVCLATTSEKLAHGVQLLLAGLGIYARVNDCHDSRDNRGTLHHIVIAYASERKKFEEQIGFVSSDKKEKLRLLNREVLGKAKGNVNEETVVAFEYLGKKRVFDIQTSSGVFSANGVVVHNCYIQSVNDDLVNEGGIMDLWVREARLFKYGSGTGTNFSSLRGAGERLSGGGKSSGIQSWLLIGDRAAGAIKSGGTTRRAAKMVILDMDHPEVEWFINWKVEEEKKVAALVAAGYPADYEGSAYQTVSGQNSNNSVRVPNKFIESVLNDGQWELKGRVDSRVNRTLQARNLWDEIAYAAWRCADPGIQFDTTINEWHTCPQSGRIRATNPCSEYVFLDDTACNLASINLAHFYDTETHQFDVDGYRHAIRIWAMTLEISVLMSAGPYKKMAEGTYQFRTLGLGYANLGAVLMTAGIPYDSPEAIAFTGAVTAMVTGECYRTSAEMSKTLGPFREYAKNRDDMLRIIRNHRRAAYNARPEEYEGLSVTPVGIDPKYCPEYLLAAARQTWDEALALGEQYGYRNAQTTALAPTGTIGLLMDCATTGVEPDFALVKFKKLAGGGYFKIVNEAVPTALRTLGYTEAQIDDIIAYMRGRGTLEGAPAVNHETLKAKGFVDEDIQKLERNLRSVFELRFAFNVWMLGEDTMKRLDISETEYNDLNFNMLERLGFVADEIAQANEYVCGSMTIEGAPHLKEQHYAVFDCANKCGVRGERYIHFLGHVRMLAAAQPFISGSLSKTINMPNDATVDDVKKVYMESWRLGLKCLAIYRDGCKLSQPLSTKSENGNGNGKKEKDSSVSGAVPVVIAPVVAGVQTALVSEPAIVAASSAGGASRAVDDYSNDGEVVGKRVYIHGERRKLPAKRSGITVEASVGGQKLFIRTGEYPDGTLGEIFIDMFKEGAAYRSVLNSFAVAVSFALQHGVPLEKLVEKFTFTRFEPAGATTHPNVKFATSILDFIFRVLGMEYLGRTDFVQVPPKGIQRNRAAQLVRLAEVQKTIEMPLASPPAPDVQSAHDAEIPVPAAPVSATDLGGGVNAYLKGMMGDAPMCDQCGHVTIRNGSCYKCLNCGSTTGCS